MLNSFRNILLHLIAIAPSSFGLWLRQKIYGRNVKIKYFVELSSRKYITFGKDVAIDSLCRIIADTDGFITFGNNVALNRNVLINARGGGRIIVGNDVLIGPNVVIRSNNHRFESLDIPINSQGVTLGCIIIEDDVWIAANCVILPNVKIGKGAIIGAGSVVTRDVEPYSIMGGIPAKKIGSRIKDEKTH